MSASNDAQEWARQGIEQWAQHGVEEMTEREATERAEMGELDEEQQDDR